MCLLLPVVIDFRERQAARDYERGRGLMITLPKDGRMGLMLALLSSLLEISLQSGKIRSQEKEYRIPSYSRTGYSNSISKEKAVSRKFGITAVTYLTPIFMDHPVDKAGNF